VTLLNRSKLPQGWQLQQHPMRIEGEVPEMPGEEEDLALMSTDYRKTFLQVIVIELFDLFFT
jgi:hypothetical protein